MTNSWMYDPEPQPPSKTELAIHRYEDHMEDVKRMEAVAKQCVQEWEARETVTGDSRADVSLCYLMLRMICESMLLASVMVHDVFVSALGKRIISKEYKPKRIVAAVEKVNPYWYPRSVVLRNTDSSLVDQSVLWYNEVDVRPPGGWLTQKEFTRLYSTCGGYLHVCWMENRSVQAAMEHAADVCSRLELLLKQHLVTLFDDVTLVVEMVGPWNGRVAVLDLYSPSE
ncbi:MAG: hypothetical protein OXM02_11925 [Bacteroidota bacterium]|nr:hypothetical protein [Bacteroidota bacterium]